MGLGWPARADELDEEQRRLAALCPPAWQPSRDGFSAVGVFLAFARGEQGPGQAGDHGWVAAAGVQCPSHRTLASHCVPCLAGARYEAGRLALREGPCLESAVRALPMSPHVLIVDATGRDHPRRAGLALHLGALLDLPSIGVTHRPLVASGAEPADAQGSMTPLTLAGEVVGAWLRTQSGTRPVAVHAGWRTNPETAVHVALACAGPARTPEPLRRARVLARTTRAHAEGRTAQAWQDPLASFA